MEEPVILEVRPLPEFPEDVWALVRGAHGLRVVTGTAGGNTEEDPDLLEVAHKGVLYCLDFQEWLDVSSGAPDPIMLAEFERM